MLIAVFSNPDVTRYWSHPPSTQEQQAQDLLAAIERAFVDQSLPREWEAR